MKLRKSIIVMLLLVVAMVITACNGDEGQPVTDDTAANDTAATTDGDGYRAMVGNMYIEGLPIVREPESFTLFADESGAPEDIVLFPIWNAETNVTAILELMPHEAAMETINIRISTGDYPDVIGGWLFFNEARAMDLALRDGIVIPLQDLIRDYAPNIEAALNLPGVREAMTMPDGNIYSFPYIVEAGVVAFSPWINQEWLDNLGLAMPTTVDEFTNVLRAFRDGDPRGDGVPVIPFTVDPQNHTITNMTGYWGINAAAQGPYAYMHFTGSEFVFAPALDEFRQMMIWFASLWDEGLLDPEMFTQDRAMWTANGRNGLFGVSTAYAPVDFAEEFEAVLPDGRIVIRTAYEPLPVLRAVDGVRPVWRRNADEVGTNIDGNPVGIQILRSQIFITNAAENPATIVRYFDHIFSPLQSIQTHWGLLGETFEEVGPMQFRKFPESELSEETRERLSLARLYVQALPRQMPIGLQPIRDEGIWPYDHTGSRDVLYLPYLTPLAPQAWLPADSVAEIAQINADLIETYMRGFIADVTVGLIDLRDDAAWARHLEQIELLGASRRTEIINSAIRR